jgi:putative polyketide hydroxylase
MIETPVLVVGGSLVGLANAAFLASHGVACMVVERHPDLLIHPRLRGLYPRVMEALRQIGLEEAIQDAAFRGGDAGWRMVAAETLAGEHHPAGDHEPQGAPAASPCPMANVDQDKVEVVLRAHAAALGADLRFSTELRSFAQDPDGVTATLEDRRTGERFTVRARYLVAADGAASPTRQRLGVASDGPGILFHTITALVDADLRPALRGRRADIAYLQRPRPGTILMAHDADGRRWVFGTGFRPDLGERREDFPPERCADLVREAAGLPDAEVAVLPQIPGTGLTVLAFSIGARVARQYRAGRVFLTGDAAHMVPPTGGLGGGTGILDAHNLAWKLAMVLRGEAGRALVDTYHAERHPVGLLTMGQALARGQARMGLGEGAAVPEVLSYDTVTLGYRYRSSAVIGAEDAEPLPAGALSGQPGTRAPHVPLPGGRSTLDWYGRRLVLLAGPDGGAWLDAAARLDVAVDAHRLPGDVAARHGLDRDSALLVRPDGFVAWRGTGPAAALDRVVAKVLGRRVLEPQP